MIKDYGGHTREEEKTHLRSIQKAKLSKNIQLGTGAYLYGQKVRWKWMEYHKLKVDSFRIILKCVLLVNINYQSDDKKHAVDCVKFFSKVLIINR